MSRTKLGHWLRRTQVQAWLAQSSVFLSALLILAFMIYNLQLNLERQGISSGFDFLGSTAGFDINLHLISYSEESTYGQAFLVGLLNTLLVSGLGIIFATVIGFIVGIARLSSNFLLRSCASTFVETLRNIPLLLQLFFWYFAVLRNLPGPRQSLQFGDHIFLNVRGLYIPWLSSDGGWHWSFPELAGFNFQGGLQLLPEFVALLLALSLYTASFIAEIVRAGILSVPKGQSEAARALGLSSWQCMRLVVIPQALRVVIPPLTSQYLNLTKNSSLAAAIAFPDLVLVFAGTVLNQTGQAVEVIFLTMAVYLLISLLISYGMNRYNQSLMLRGERL